MTVMENYIENLMSEMTEIFRGMTTDDAEALKQMDCKIGRARGCSQNSKIF